MIGIVLLKYNGSMGSWFNGEDDDMLNCLPWFNFLEVLISN
jgi:hypothetical protein